MSDAGGTRLTVDNDLYRAPPPTNPLLLGDPEAAGVVESSQAMEPVVGPYLRDVVTGEMARRSLNDLSVPYDPSKSFRENVLNPQAMQAAENIALGFSGGGMTTRSTGPLPRLWHGAAREWEGGRADPKKLESGEGVHMEGHGLYTSEGRKVGEWYQKEYGDTRPEHLDQVTDELLEHFASRDPELFSGHDRILEENEIMNLMGRQGLDPANPSDWVRFASATIPGYDRGLLKRGTLYELEYPGARIEEFMRWDKPLREQSDYVKQRLKRLGIEEGKDVPKEWWGDRPPKDKTFGGLDGDSLYSFIGTKYGTWLRTPGVSPSGDPATAAVMRLNGIRGVRYPASEVYYPKGTVHNYSIFNPEALNIIKQYGMAGLMAGAGGAAPLLVGEAQAAGPRWQMTPVDHNPFANE